MDRIKEFLSTISHEIRTPLTSIKGFSKTILDSYDNLSDEQKKKFIKIILDQSKRLETLIENVLLAASSDDNYLNPVFKKTDINSVLKKSIELVKINYIDISYKTNLSENLYSPLDIDKLQQIFVNLLDNASKYSVDSNIVDIKTGVNNNKNYVSIKNYGIFISNEEKDKIFQKFYRIDSYLTSKKQGSGLGLYIVKMLVEQMKGEIFITSKQEPSPFVEIIVTFPIFAIEEFTKGAKNV